MKSLSRRKAAARAGVSPNTFKNYAERGIGPAFVQLHGKYLYEVSVVDACIAARMIGGAA